jgi:hypothetical protein
MNLCLTPMVNKMVPRMNTLKYLRAENSLHKLIVSIAKAKPTKIMALHFHTIGEYSSKVPNVGSSTGNCTYP